MNIVNYVIKGRILAELMSWCYIFVFDFEGAIQKTWETPI